MTIFVEKSLVKKYFYNSYNSVNNFKVEKVIKIPSDISK